jgi:hypothetical protein
MNSQAIIMTYIRFDGTNIPAPTTIAQNFHILLYHVNGSTFNTSNITAQTLLNFVADTQNVRQQITLTTIIGQNLAEWDGINLQITNLDTNSAIIIFVMQKAPGTMPGIVVNNPVDYYFLNSALNTFQTNPNLVYNTDNYFLLEMTSAIDTFIALPLKPTKTDSGIVISSNPTIQAMYDNIYTTILNREINIEVDSEVGSGTYTPAQLQALKQKLYEALLLNTAKMNAIELESETLFNNQYRGSFYTKYLQEQQYNTVDIIETMNENINTVQCLIPFSSIARTDTQESAIRLSLHYQMSGN